MATTVAVAQLVAGQIIRTLEDNLIAKKICNLSAAGEIKKKGDRILFPGLADPTVSNYTGTVSYEKLNATGVTLIVDQAKYYAFEVSDIEALQTGLDLKTSQATRAGYMLKNTADKYVMSLYSGAGTALTATDPITPDNVLSMLSKLHLALAEKNVSENDMWIVVPHWVKQMMTLAGVKFSINNGTNGTGTLAFTNELGFDLFASNQVTMTGTGDNTLYHVMAGSYNSIIYAEQLLENEIIRLQSSFSNGARGLHVYGAKIVNPTELVTAPLKKGAF